MFISITRILNVIKFVVDEVAQNKLKCTRLLVFLAQIISISICLVLCPTVAREEAMANGFATDCRWRRCDPDPLANGYWTASGDRGRKETASGGQPVHRDTNALMSSCTTLLAAKHHAFISFDGAIECEYNWVKVSHNIIATRKQKLWWIIFHPAS